MTRAIGLVCLLVTLASQVVADELATRLLDATTKGMPLIEPISNSRKQVLVTFVWRGDASTKSVHVITIDQVQFSNAAYLERARMTRVDGTNVWYRTYRMRCDLLFSYRFAINGSNTDLRADPFNPVHYASRSGDSSVAKLPCAEPEPDMATHDGVPHGEVQTDTLGGHALQIYVPARHDASAALVISVGGQFADNYPVPAILDNLIAAKRIPPTVVVSIGFKDMTEYVSASRSNETFARHVAKELLPWLRARYRITNDPRRVVISGASAPGAASIFIAMRYPTLFGNVITQGGGYSYPISPDHDELIPSEHPETEPIARELATRPALPFRVFLAVGTMDDVTWEGKDPRYAASTVLVAARHLRNVLDARGYCLTYREFGGAHEALVWRRTFAEGVVELLGENGKDCK